MTVADRIALIADGELIEHGKARDIYQAPERKFTASFVGENNILAGEVTAVSGSEVTVAVGNGERLKVDSRSQQVSVGDKVHLSIRSELTRMDLGNGKAEVKSGHSVSGSYNEAVYLGLTTSHIVTVGPGQDMVSRVVDDLEDQPEPGADVRLYWTPGALRLHTH